MMVRVLLFAAAREAVGANDVRLRLHRGATFAILREQLRTTYPQAAQVVARANFAAGERYVSDNDSVPSVGEIALIPPVSGG
jgi:molybdopterin converting factor subunit 1